MPYIEPEFDALLLDKDDSIKNHVPDETAAHHLLADQLTTIIEFISKQKIGNELHAELIGAHIYCLEIISQEYFLHSPELKIGYIYSSGSPLYSFIAKRLNITSENKLTSRDKFIFLSRFYQLVSEKTAELAIEKETLIKIKKLLRNFLYTLTTDIANIVNAIPTEKAVTKHMDKLPDEYQKKKAAQNNSWFSYFRSINKNRPILRQLAKLIAQIQCEDETNLPPNQMTRSQRFKMGLLLCIDNIIEDEYWFRSATNSILYCECKDILNSHYVENLNTMQKLACLAAFRSLISSNEERAKLEIAARENFKEENVLENIDSILEPLCHQLKLIEQKIASSQSSTWTATLTLSNIGRLGASAPFYGFGSALGYATSETQSTNIAKGIAGTAASNIATAIFHTNSAGYFAFAMGNFIIASTLTRAFAKLFEYFGMALGGAAGGIIGFTFDLSYKGFTELCKYFLNYCDEHPIQMRNADRTFIQCLLALPQDVFSEEKQNQIRYANGEEPSQEKMLKSSI